MGWALKYLVQTLCCFLFYIHVYNNVFPKISWECEIVSQLLETVIAMSFPSSGKYKIYRNPILVSCAKSVIFY